MPASKPDYGQGGTVGDLSDQETVFAHSFGLSPDIAASEYTYAHGVAAGPPNPNAPRGGLDLPLKKRVVDAYKELSEMSPEEITVMQHRLYDGGFFSDAYYASGKSKKDIEWGSLDDATIDAFGTVMQRSARSGGRLTPGEVMDDAVGKGHGKQKEEGKAPEKPNLTIQLTDPNELVAVADATARKVLGRKLTDSELRSYVDAFHSMEANAQRSKYSAEVGPYDEASGSFRGPGGTITAPPDAGSFALSKLRQENPDDVRNTEMAHGYEIFHDLLRGGA